MQFCTGKRMITTEGWLKTRGTKSFDVDFIQIKKPFTGIVPIKYEETPICGELELGVLGYPGDLVDKQTGEKGAFMYEKFFLKVETLHFSESLLSKHSYRSYRTIVIMCQLV